MMPARLTALKTLLAYSTARRLRQVALTLILLALLLLPGAGLAQEVTPAQSQAERATVFVMQAYDEDGTQAISCVGSGTLISPTGLILTNAHLGQSTGACRAEKIIIGLPVRAGEPPVPTYLAELLQADSKHDLAILQITAGLDGSLVSHETLNLPSVIVNPGFAITPGGTITATGYEGIGTQSVSSVETQIAGFTAETSGGKQAWIRIQQPVPGGMSGGGIYNPSGELAGVLTSSPQSSVLVASTTCLNVQDTNRDNAINGRDACVPIGAPVSVARPAAFALPLVAAAQAGLQLDWRPGQQIAVPAGDPGATRLFFSTQVNDNNIPTRIVQSFPTGTRSLFAAFNYENMRPGTPYEIRASLNGREIPGFGLGTQAWTGGTSGLWTVGLENVAWENGEYEFTLFVDSRPVQTASVQMGGSGESTRGVFADLTFGIFDDSGNFANPGTLLPSGEQTVTGRFNYEQVVDGADWTEAWYYNGDEVYRNTLFWSESANGQRAVRAVNAEGLPPGQYRLDLLVGENVAATADLILAGSADRNKAPIIFGQITTANDITREGQPTGIINGPLPEGTTNIYAFANWDNMPVGVEWTQHWTRDGQPVASSTQRWDGGLLGDNFWVNLFAPEGLSEGTYRVELFVQDRLMTAASITVGSGSGATSGQASQTNTVEITGTVTDALTGEGIAGVGIYALKTEFDLVDFLWDVEQLQAQAISDSAGRFAMDRPFPRGILYTFIVRAQGYLPNTEDGFFVPDEQESPMEIRIELVQP